MVSIRYTLIATILLFATTVPATSQENEKEAPVQINVTTGDLKLEIEGLGTTLATARASLEALTKNLNQLSERDDLSSDDLQLIHDITTELTRSINNVTNVANNLPENIRNSQQPIKAIGDDFMSSIRTTVYLSLIAVLIIVTALLLLIYHYVFKPIKVIASNMESISHSVEKTITVASKLDTNKPDNADSNPT